jgi:hypothetical protein
MEGRQWLAGFESFLLTVALVTDVNRAVISLEHRHRVVHPS